MTKLKESFKLFSLCLLVSCAIVLIMTAVVADLMPTAKEIEPMVEMLIQRMGL